MTGISDLNRFLSSRSSQMYLPGSNDCATFQADCCVALTGVDPIGEWRGRYSSFREGLRMMREAGFRNPRHFVEAHGESVNPGFSCLGDFAFRRNAGGFVVGHLAYFLDKQGLAYYPVSNEIDVFRVTKW